MTDLDRQNSFYESNIDHRSKSTDEDNFDPIIVSALPTEASIKKPKKTKTKKPSLSKTQMRGNNLIGSSPAISLVRDLIKLYGPEDETILITGETGTGKEVVAQYLHAESRANEHFLSHNAGRVDHHLTGSEFFGHKRGAFTGAIEDRNGLFVDADGGTLHLDEIGEMPFDLQANLLRTIEDGVVTPLGSSCSRRVNVRIIAATNKDLLSETNARRFRSDLYHRLNVLRIDVPPLRARDDDVIEIATYFLEMRFQKTGHKHCLSPGAIKKLSKHSWPGNVRELKNVILRAAVISRSDVIDEDAIQLDSQPFKTAIDLETARDLVSRYLIAGALEESDGSSSKAANRVGLSRQAVHAMKKKLAAEGDTYDSLAARIRDAFRLC